MRKGRRKMVTVFLLVAFMLSGSATSLWATEEKEADLNASSQIMRYQYIKYIIPNLSISSSGIAHCSGSMETWDPYTVEMTLGLQKYNSNKKRWEQLYTWPKVRGNGAMGVSKTGNYNVGSGKYRVALTGKVLSSNNVVLENVTVYSREVSR